MSDRSARGAVIVVGGGFAGSYVARLLQATVSPFFRRGIAELGTLGRARGLNGE